MQNTTKYTKLGFFGEQGSGKSTTAALYAAALSKEVCNGAPVFVTDPELSWQFLPIFPAEKIKLVQRTVPTFQAMLKDMRDAEREGCVWAVELGKLYSELLKTVQRECGDRWGMELHTMWGDFVDQFIDSRVHCLALSRVADLNEEVINEQGKLQRIKIAEGMRAGGQRNNFAYEPHLVLRMTLERKPRTKNGKQIEGEGSMVHRADVLKDRTWTLNGKVIRWIDKQSYKPGGYAQVWTALRPHFNAVQEAPIANLDREATSSGMIERDGRSEWWEQKQRQEALLAEVQASFDLLWGGNSNEAKRIRLLAADRIFGVRTKEARENLECWKIERGLKILQAVEEIATADPKDIPVTESGWLTIVDDAIQNYERPGAKKTVTSILLERSISAVNQ